MFWRCDEQRLSRALDRLHQKLELSKESDAALTELTEWLSHNQAKFEEEWSHDDLLGALVSDSNADKDTVLKEVRDSLQSMEAFAVILIEKLDAFRVTLSDEQRALLADELRTRGRRPRSWQGWHRRHGLRHRQRAA
jgi:hypothetical protein